MKLQSKTKQNKTKARTWSPKSRQFDGGKTGAVGRSGYGVNAPQKDVHVFLAVGLISIEIGAGHRSVPGLGRRLHRLIFLVLFA